MTTAAAWVVALAAWAGALVALPAATAWWSPATWPAAGGAALVAAALVVGAFAAACPDADGAVDPAGRPARVARLVLLAVAVALATAGAGGARAAIASGGVLAALAEDRAAVSVDATAVTDVRGEDGGWQVVRVDAVDGRAVRERAWWWLAPEQASEAATTGQRVRADVRLTPLEADGLDGHVARLHAVARLEPRQAPQVVGEAGWWLASSERVRARAAAANHARLDPVRAGVLTALVTGDRRGEPPELRHDFAAAGLTHLVVVSGKHVAGVLAGVLLAAALAGCGARSRRVLALAALAWFVVLVRWQPSVLRAGAMAGLVLAAGVGGRGSDPRHALAVAVTLLLLVDPFLAGQLGFGLSVGATAGVLVVAPWLAERLPVGRWLAVPLAVSLGAQLGAAPLLLTLDGLGAGSVPANLVAVPAAALAQAIGLVAALVAQVSVVVGGLVAVLAGPAVSVIVWAATAFAAGPRLTAASLSSPLLWMGVGLVVAAVVVRRRWPRAPAPAWVAAVLVAVALAPLPSRPAADVEHLTATFLDVGQGLAVLVEAPDGEGTARMLYDAGEDDAVLALLRDRRISSLDVLALSHPHHDHVGGMPAVVDAMAVGRVLLSPNAPSAQLSALDDLEAAARGAGVPGATVAGGQHFALGDAEVRVLGPPAHGALDDDSNDGSLVLSVIYQGGRLLLTGDAEAAAQQHLLRRSPQRLPAGVLQVAHHGGDTNADGFHDAVGAQVGVIGVGADNDFGHPHKAVLDDLRAAGTTVYRTDVHGSVTVTVDGERVHVAPQRHAPRQPALP